MPAAVRITDITNHGGMVAGPGVPNVLLGGLPAAVVGDMHICVIPVSTGHITAGPFPAGSATVLIGGRPALRITDISICGAAAVAGLPTVNIGG